MSRLLSTVRIAHTTTTSPTSAFQVSAPSNHKLVVRVAVHNLNATATDPPVQIRLVRGQSQTGATLNSASTLVKVNALDTETPQATVKTYSAQPSAETTGGRVGFGLVKPGGEEFVASAIVNGGETLDCWVECSPSQNLLVIPLIEE